MEVCKTLENKLVREVGVLQLLHASSSNSVSISVNIYSGASLENYQCEQSWTEAETARSGLPFTHSYSIYLFFKFALKICFAFCFGCTLDFIVPYKIHWTVIFEEAKQGLSSTWDWHWRGFVKNYVIHVAELFLKSLQNNSVLFLVCQTSSDCQSSWLNISKA